MIYLDERKNFSFLNVADGGVQQPDEVTRSENGEIGDSPFYIYNCYPSRSRQAERESPSEPEVNPKNIETSIALLPASSFSKLPKHVVLITYCMRAAFGRLGRFCW